MSIVFTDVHFYRLRLIKIREIVKCYILFARVEKISGRVSVAEILITGLGVVVSVVFCGVFGVILSMVVLLMRVSGWILEQYKLSAITTFSSDYIQLDLKRV